MYSEKEIAEIFCNSQYLCLLPPCSYNTNFAHGFFKLVINMNSFTFYHA